MSVTDIAFYFSKEDTDDLSGLIQSNFTFRIDDIFRSEKTLKLAPSLKEEFRPL